MVQVNMRHLWDRVSHMQDENILRLSCNVVKCSVNNAIHLKVLGNIYIVLHFCLFSHNLNKNTQKARV